MQEKAEKSYQGLKQTYVDIFKLSLEISSINSLEQVQRIMQINLKKEHLIKTATRLKASVVLNEEEKKDIENLVEKIKALESKNIKKITEMKDKVASDIATLNKSITLAGAYKAKDEIKSRLVDTSE